MNKCPLCGANCGTHYMCFPCKQTMRKEIDEEVNQEFVKQCQLPPEQQSDIFKEVIQNLFKSNPTISEMREAFYKEYFEILKIQRLDKLRQKCPENFRFKNPRNGKCPLCGEIKEYANRELCIACHQKSKLESLQKEI